MIGRPMRGDTVGAFRGRHNERNEGTMATGALGEWGERLGARIGEFSASIHFLTRLPLPRHETAGAAGANLAQAAWAVPLAGFVVGLIGAIVYALADRLLAVFLSAGAP